MKSPPARRGQSLYSEGSLAHYRCEEGRVRSGQRTRQCREDGRWAGDIPVCSEYSVLYAAMRIKTHKDTYQLPVV